MLRVGLTGGIGSGKTTVAKIFETLGIPVYDADIEAKRLMNSDPQIREGIIDAFGKESYEGTVPNRSFLIAHVLSDEKKLTRLNAIVHPVTIADAERWMKEQTTPYALKEAAIIFETGSEKYLDFVIGVTAPQELRVERIMQRDGRSEGEIKQLMSRQMDEQEKMKRCDFVIYNDGEKMLIPQVIAVHQQLLKKARERDHL